MYKRDKLPLEYMVKPDSGFKRTIADLKATYDLDFNEIELRTREYFEKSDEMAEIYNAEEVEVIRAYSDREIAAKINECLRTDETLLHVEDQRRVKVLHNAIEKFAFDEDIVVYRGFDDYKKAFDGQFPVEGQKTIWNGFVSTTIDRHTAGRYSRYTEDSVVIELVVPKGTHGIMMGTEKLSLAHKNDKEFLLSHETRIEVIVVEKKTNGYYVKARVVGN
jgi:hypothetical protein